MAKVVIEIPDDYVDWARWARDELARGGLLPRTQTAQNAGPTPTYQGGPENASGVLHGGATEASGGQSPPDPWAGNNSATATSTPTPSSQPQTITKETPNGPIVYQFGLSGAPNCLCGNPAAKVRGNKKAGGTYTAFKCAKTAGDNWQDKCDFVQWG